MTGLRFGVVSESVREGRAWLEFARQVEDAGIDVLLLRDHFSAGGVRAATGAVHGAGRRGGRDHAAAGGHDGAVQRLPPSGRPGPRGREPAPDLWRPVRAWRRGRLVPARVPGGGDRVRCGGPANLAAGRVARDHQGSAGRHAGPPAGRVLPDRRAGSRRPADAQAGRAAAARGRRADLACCGSPPGTRTSSGCCRPRSATRTAPRIPGTGCRRRSTPSWPCSGRPPGTGSPALRSTRSPRSSSPAGAARRPRT